MAKNDVIEDLQKSSFLDPVGSVNFVGVSTNDSRWRAVMREDNPYLPSLQETYKPHQQEWLIEQGLDFEASQEAMMRKAQLDYALLEDQREYESPQARIARERIAGINPDVPGSSSSAGAGGSAPISGQNISISSNSSDASANESSVRWQAAASMLGAFTQLGQAIVSAVDTFSTMPGRVALGEAQGQLALNQASLIKQQTPSIVSKAQSESSSAFTDAAMKNLSLYDSMAQMFTSDSTDDEISSLLSTLGYGDDIIPRHLTNFRNYQKNPALQKLYTDNKVESAKSQSYANSYSIKMYGDTVALQQKIEYDSLRLDELQTSLQHSFNSYLSTAGYPSLSAQNLIDSQKLSSEEISLSRQKLEQDLRAYTSYIYNLAQYASHSQETINRVRENAFAYNPKTKKREPRALTVDEQRIVDSESLKQLMVGMLGSRHLQTLVNMYNHSSHLKYVTGEYIDPYGDVKVMPTSEARIRFEDYTFNMIVDNASTGTATAESLFDSMVGMIPVVGGIMLKTSNNSTSKRP